MKKQLIIVGILACSFAKTNFFAQQKQQKDSVEVLKEVVITATKFKLKKQNTGKVIYKITQQEIKQNAGKTAIDLLNNLPGIEIKGSNTNPSEPRSTYVRGGRSRQVLILIDGVPVSDPSGINQEYDLRLLSLNQIESIEVLKGASSTLYGSGAATGVINIILKKASKNTISGSFETSFGTNNDANSTNSFLSDVNQNANVNGSIGNFTFLSTISLTGKEGLSSAKSNTSQVFEEDKYESKNGLLKLGYQFSNHFSVESFVNFDEFSYDYDAAIYTDSNINNGKQTQVRFGLKPRFTYNSGEIYLLTSVNKVKRTDNNFSSFSNSVNESIFEGESLNLDLVNKYDISNKIQLIAGVNYQDHQNNTTSPFGNIDEDLANFNTLDPYLSAVYISNFGLNVNLGSRLNMHSNYGNHFVYDANVSYNVFSKENTNVKLLSSYGTAFIAPSTYQLFSVFGNTDLNPETSKTLEAGFDASVNSFINVSAVYFNRTENESIIFQGLGVAPFGIYQNSTEEIKVSGVEATFNIKPIDKVSLDVNYTFTDKETDVDYIPKHKLVANLGVNPTENTFVSLVYKSVGERVARFFDNNTFTTVETTLPKYNLLDFNINYKLLDETVTFFGTVSNIFNEDYEDILGYSTRGRNYKVGVRLQF
ncbi:TonB-dependent receptor [Polaribacter aestuariivivens]|uniref:TonB-dependent receptor n=1 Tax=Polaribacter aestuariivivens TaxID=2304626 RepID=A0A5S3N6Y5_9FLAO|nr:TonB-dependent receptor [Polaribacter aestuariivivens]TMM31111.1 TonB-dependent receptor [Polaribacter aestuariivivens]